MRIDLAMCCSGVRIFQQFAAIGKAYSRPHLATVRALEQAARSGQMTGTADYDVFGGVRSSSGAMGIFGYAGQQTDSETGFSFRRSRSMSPTLGRFISADSVQPNADGSQGYNRYVYTANNPATLTDPSGHSTASAGELAWAGLAVDL